MTPDWSPDPDSHELVDVVTPSDGPNEIDLINTDTGARTTLAPSAGSPGYFSVRFGLSGDGAQSFHHVTKLALEASELQKPIAYGVFLQRLGGKITSCVGTDKQVGGEVKANAGVSMSPKIDDAPIFVGDAFSLDGTGRFPCASPRA
jgi:hypothetical protein